MTMFPTLEVVRRAVYGKIGKFTKSDTMEMCPKLGKTPVESLIEISIYGFPFPVGCFKGKNLNDFL